MQDSAKEQLTARILKWLPQGHIVVVDAPDRNKDAIVMGWMNAYGTTSITEITFEQQLIDMIQKIIEAHDENLLNRYMEQIEAHVLSLAAANEDGNSEKWHLTQNIL